MSMPPPGDWQPGSPPNHGQPGYNPQQPPPGWQQGNWPQQLGPPPPPKGNGLKWLLIGVAVLLAIGITVGATLLFTRDNGRGGTTTSTSAAPSDFASVNDTGPVAIVTNEPTCQSYMSINNSIADVEANWGAQRGSLGPASSWTPDQRSQVESVVNAIRNAADQVVPLAKQTPHRVVRELYEQFIAYGRAYADSIDNYTPVDNSLASANVNAGSALAGICNAITYGSAARSVAITPAAEPSNPAQPTDLGKPQRFVTGTGQSCTDWTAREAQFTQATTDWANLDSGIVGSQWTADQRALQQSAVSQLADWANDMETMGKKRENPVFEDFALTAALYIRAYIPLGSKYIDTDAWLTYTAFRLSNVISGACRAEAG